MQPKQGVGTWVHPLEENIERKALTAAERSKKLVRQAEQAEEVLREHAEVPPEPNTEEAAHGQEPDSQSDKDFSPNAGEKPKRGRPKQPDSEDRVAEYLGVPQQTVNLAKQHVAAMEKYPLLGKPRQIFRDIYGWLSRP